MNGLVLRIGRIDSTLTQTDMHAPHTRRMVENIEVAMVDDVLNNEPPEGGSILVVGGEQIGLQAAQEVGLQHRHAAAAVPLIREAMEAGWQGDFPGGEAGNAPLASTYFNLRKTTIYGGSNEVQRNIVAQTVLVDLGLGFHRDDRDHDPHVDEDALHVVGRRVARSVLDLTPLSDELAVRDSLLVSGGDRAKDELRAASRELRQRSKIGRAHV